MLPFNYAVGTLNGTNLIINTMQQQVEIYISLPQSTGCIPTHAAVFFDLKNQFNSISRKAFFNVISKSFPEMLPLTTLFYKHAKTVHHKWANGTWCTLLMDKGISQGCPLSPIFASLVITNLLQPLDIELRKKVTTRLLNGDPGNDEFGGITHLLGCKDDVSACISLADLQFFCDQFATIGAPLGCFVNPMKARILTSTSCYSPIPDLFNLNPILATSITDTISQYSTKPNDIDVLGPPLLAKLTTGFRLLGSPVGSPAFAQEYFNTQLAKIQNCIAIMSTA
jgi:hypothetical protein